ncbi:signal peptide protein [Xylanibacillus composti]|uniref:Uncharacterized protein n=1 Tax=Xylanibacillus composti TaxID=1572762 RepID=A0A8J4M3M3_9BACL|nr:hypothetical protein [Xylanibacillus composti]MDT9724590.1 signal peptide protein [Xylanibacillus composti]GIQ70250.1 hypothetical protein XYCOK13_30740 [Xylanibacillus composti]
MKQGRLGQLLVIGGIILVVLFIIGKNSDTAPDVLQTANSPLSGGSASAVPTENAVSSASVVPWDYRIAEREVGDIIGGDMVLLPNNELLPNDNHFATGDKVWVLEHMSATMRMNEDGRNQVTLSEWKMIKSYTTQEAAEEDLANLKVLLETEVDLVGVYKTEHEGEFRQFAVVTLPSGHDIKQPIDTDRYEALKSQERVKVQLEEVHDYEDYDMAMAKFRGWAE